MDEKEKIRELLKTVVDPEIKYDIVSIGLIYDISVDGKRAKIRMTLTTPMCPYGPLLVADVEKKLRDNGYDPEIDVVFEPPWTPEMMDQKLRDILGI